jgi:hypothetical protein
VRPGLDLRKAQRFAIRLILLSLILMAASMAWTAAQLWMPRQHRNTRANFKPFCDGLRCQVPLDCGSKCLCEHRSDSAMGICVAK